MAFDLFTKIRKKRIFNPYGLTPPEEGEPRLESSGLFQPDSPFRIPPPGMEEEEESIPRQPSPMLDRYRTALDEMPDRGNYRTPLLKRILAGVAAFGSNDPYGYARGIIDEPYNRDLESWSRKVRVMGQQADIETEANRREIDRIKAMADMGDKESLRKLRDWQIKNYENQIQTRETPEQATARRIREHSENRLFDLRNPTPDRRIFEDNLSGTSYVVDLNDPTKKVSLGRTGETPQERADRTVNIHERTRNFDVANPLVQPGIQPSQESAATIAAVRNTVLNNPKWGKFVSGGQLSPPTGWFGGDPSDEANKEYKAFTDAVDIEKKRIIDQARRGNPLNPGNLPKTLEEEARAHFKAKGESFTEEDVKWLASQPKPW